MGAWGVGPTENDTAMDAIGWLEEGPLTAARIRRAMDFNLSPKWKPSKREATDAAIGVASHLRKTGYPIGRFVSKILKAIDYDMDEGSKDWYKDVFPHRFNRLRLFRREILRAFNEEGEHEDRA